MQDIRGLGLCKICNHIGQLHAVGFFCLAEGCCCGHHKDDPIHQQYGGVGGKPCKSCDPATTAWKGPTGFELSDDRGARLHSVAKIYSLRAP